MDQKVMDHFYRIYAKDGSPLNASNDAQRALQAGKTLQESLRITDQQMIQYYNYANELYEQQNYEDAADIFFLLTQLNPLAQPFWLAFANSEWMNGRFDAAFAAYQMAIVLDPQNPESYLTLAKCCVDHNEKEAAIDYLNLMEASCEPTPERESAIAYKKSLEATAV